jgi:hypothetical protein
MKRTESLAILALALALALAPVSLARAAPLAAEAAMAWPEILAPRPGFAELGALAEPLGAANLLRAALLASGLAPGDLGPYEEKVDGLIEALRAEAGKAADPAARGEAILGFLHNRVLRAYRENATTLSGLLETGLYNCVSSAVLYLIAARSLGIMADGARTSDHAFCTVLAGGRKIDVETTNTYGFDPGGKKEFKDSFGRLTGYAYVAPGGYGDRRAIGGRELVGLILANRASSLERSGRFAEAARLGAEYAALCPGAESRGFFADRINNLVAELENRRDYAAAEAAAKAAAAALPGDARMAALSRKASEIVGDMGLVRAVNELPFAEGLAAAGRILEAGDASPARYAQAIATIYGNEAIRRGDAGDWLGAAELAESGAAFAAARGFKDDGSLARLARDFRHNYVAEAHNRFARLYNAGDYRTAKSSLGAALAAFPGDATLQRDLAAAEAALKR